MSYETPEKVISLTVNIYLDDSESFENVFGMSKENLKEVLEVILLEKQFSAS